MSKPKFFRDPVHLQLRFENVPLSDTPRRLTKTGRRSWLLRNLIDSPDFQRLRFKRQNGLTNLVFHGAEHTRFTHSLGVSHLAGLMYECIARNCSQKIDQDEQTIIMTAALLHDIGHGPFSHAMEEVLGGIGKDFKHENMTIRFIKEDTAVNKFLCQYAKSTVTQIIQFFDKAYKQQDNWKFKIVSGQMDADRLDYLMRDRLFSGVRGATFDIERILDLLYQYDEKSIAVKIQALEAVEKYLFALDQMYRTIYYHHAVRAATQNLISIMKRVAYLFYNGDTQIIPSAYYDRSKSLEDLFKNGEDISLLNYGRLT